MKILRKVDENLEEVLLVLLLICMVCIMGVQVLARYAFNQSLSWSEELTQYMFVWSTFISVSYCVKKRISIKIEQFINAIPMRGKTWLRIMRHTLVAVFCVIMIPYSVTYVQQAITFNATSAALKIPMYYIQSAPLVGFILLFIRVVQAWIREVNNVRTGADIAEAEAAKAHANEQDAVKTEATVSIIESNLAEHEPEAEIIEENLDAIEPDIDLETLETYDPARSDEEKAAAHHYKKGGDK